MFQEGSLHKQMSVPEIDTRSLEVLLPIVVDYTVVSASYLYAVGLNGLSLSVHLVVYSGECCFERSTQPSFTSGIQSSNPFAPNT